jgi:hypothetical protein
MADYVKEVFVASCCPRDSVIDAFGRAMCCIEGVTGHVILWNNMVWSDARFGILGNTHLTTTMGACPPVFKYCVDIQYICGKAAQILLPSSNI